MEIKTYEQIYNDIRNYIIAHQDRLTDFNDGGVLSSQIEAISRELALLYVNCRVGFSTLLRSLPYMVFNFRMKEGDKAATQIIFSRTKRSSFNSPIPAGSIAAAGSLNYITTQAGDIPAGEKDSPLISAIAQEVGDRYNVKAGEINKITSTLSADIIAVNNPAPTAGGRDAEDWAAYVKRFNEFIVGLGKSSVYGIQAAAMAVNGVHSVNLVEHFPASSGYNFTLYVEDGSGGLPNDIKAKVENVVIGNKTTEGARACGVNCRILAPTKVPLDINFVFRVDGSIPAGFIEEELNEKVIGYLNSLGIGQPYERREVYDLGLHQPGVKDVISLTPDTLVPTANQVIRPGVITVEGF